MSASASAPLSSPSSPRPHPPAGDDESTARADSTAPHPHPQPTAAQQRPLPQPSRKRRAADDDDDNDDEEEDGGGNAAPEPVEATDPLPPAGTGDLPPVVTPQDDAAGLVAHHAAGHETMIEAHDADDHSVESDEFEPEEWEEGSSNASTSICSSVYNHTYENGRRYHSYKHGRYPIPNDDLEQNREDMKHAMMLELTDGKLFYAPVGDHPQRVLDIGTGTGIWAIEVGDRYPSASVLGIDLSPIQPLWLPPNVKFIIDDCEDEWLNGDGWDLVHLRTMSPILKDVPKLCRQAFANIRPGGWIEFQEMQCWMLCDDGTMAADDPAFDFYKLVYQAFRRLGFDTTLCSRLGDTLKDAGFTNINCVIRKVPVGRWPRDRRLRLVGHYLKIAIQEVLPALCGKPLSLLGLNEVERELWRSATSRALDDESVHRYWYFYFWYAQKPE